MAEPPDLSLAASCDGVRAAARVERWVPAASRQLWMAFRQRGLCQLLAQCARLLACTSASALRSHSQGLQPLSLKGHLLDTATLPSQVKCVLMRSESHQAHWTV